MKPAIQVKRDPLQVVQDQWAKIPSNVVQSYQAQTETLYKKSLSVDELLMKEAEVYNTHFEEFGLHKDILPGR